jgi:glycyl-radical enzyme activating protein family
MNDSTQNAGMVLRIERSSIHDGDGLRTVVFLKGCPLSCSWCSTPESQSGLVERYENKTYGEVMTVDQLMAEIRKDSIFYFHSGGGLTISGGEPLVQADFAAKLLKQTLSEGINTAMETSMAAPFSQVEKVLPYLDTLYADLKHIDPEAHKRCCGMDIDGILDNIRRADGRLGGAKFIIRVPLIPGLNDDPDTLHGIGLFCAGLKNLHGVQLLPYHRLGMDTYRKMGRNYPLESTRPPSDQHMENCRGMVRGHVKNVY